MGQASRKIESDHFKSFRRHLEDFPEAEVWHKDAPDFLVHRPNGVLGIEHCQVFQRDGEGTPRQAMESENWNIVALAREHAELRGTDPVSVNVTFMDHPPLRKEKRLEIAREIACLCHANLPRRGGTTRLSNDFGSTVVPPQPVARIVIDRLPTQKRHSWGPSSAGGVLEDAAPVLQAAIDEKNARASAYFQNCTECWLLLVADGSAPSSFLEPSPESLSHQYTSRFSRTFLLRYFEGLLYELSTFAPDDA